MASWNWGGGGPKLTESRFIIFALTPRNVTPAGTGLREDKLHLSLLHTTEIPPHYPSLLDADHDKSNRTGTYHLLSKRDHAPYQPELVHRMQLGFEFIFIR